jgi:Acetyltransferase (GNAT) family
MMRSWDTSVWCTGTGWRDSSLERLFVSPAAAGLGVAGALVTERWEWASSRENRLTLDVAENCTAAIGLYKRLGLHLTGRTQISWGQVRLGAFFTRCALSATFVHANVGNTERDADRKTLSARDRRWRAGVLNVDDLSSA